jgi:hypothetical protein
MKTDWKFGDVIRRNCAQPGGTAIAMVINRLPDSAGLGWYTVIGLGDGGPKPYRFGETSQPARDDYWDLVGRDA